MVALWNVFKYVGQDYDVKLVVLIEAQHVSDEKVDVGEPFASGPRYLDRPGREITCSYRPLGNEFGDKFGLGAYPASDLEHRIRCADSKLPHPAGDAAMPEIDSSIDLPRRELIVVVSYPAHRLAAVHFASTLGAE